VTFTRWNKVWVVIILCFVLVYDIYWLSSVFGSIYYILSLRLPDFLVQYPYFYLDNVFGATGDVLRFAGVILALFSVYLVWGPRPKPFLMVKKEVAVALLFEAFYFLFALPIDVVGIIRWGSLLSVLRERGIIGIIPWRSPLLLFIGFLLQILLVSPLLIVLSLKVWLYKESGKANVVKWACVAGVGYLAGIWINSVFKWLSITESANMMFGLSGIASIGFLSSITALSLSVVFAVAGCYTLLRKEDRATSKRLLAFALIMLGVHFVVFLLYSATANAWKWVLYTEIWPIALLGLGLSILGSRASTG